jgi:hypothetical protein
MTETVSPPPTPSHARRRLRVTRGVIASLLVVIGCVAVMGANAAVWLRRHAFDTDAYVETVRTLPQDERISEPMADFLVDQLFATTDAEDRIESALPDRADWLAGPLVGSSREQATAVAQDIIESEQFEEFWVQANRTAHEQAVDIVHDDPDVVDLNDGEVTLDLTQALELLRDQLGVVGDEIFANVEIPEGQGEIVVYRSETLSAMQRLIKLVDRLAWILPIVAVVAFALALAIAVHRARVVVTIGVGVAVALGIELVITRLARTEVLDLIRDEDVKVAADAAWDDIVTAGFVAQTTLMITIALVVAGAAFLAGTTRRALGLRRGAIQTWRQRVDFRPALQNVRGRVGPALAPRRGLAQVLCLAAGLVVLLLWPSITWMVLLVVLVVVAGALGLVELLSATATPAQVAGTRSSD